jgi:hypothetical protein
MANSKMSIRLPFFGLAFPSDYRFGVARAAPARHGCWRPSAAGRSQGYRIAEAAGALGGAAALLAAELRVLNQLPIALFVAQVVPFVHQETKVLAMLGIGAANVV